MAQIKFCFFNGRTVGSKTCTHWRNVLPNHANFYVTLEVIKCPSLCWPTSHWMLHCWGLHFNNTYGHIKTRWLNVCLFVGVLHSNNTYRHIRTKSLNIPHVGQQVTNYLLGHIKTMSLNACLLVFTFQYIHSVLACFLGLYILTTSMIISGPGH